MSGGRLGFLLVLFPNLCLAIPVRDMTDWHKKKRTHT